MAGSLEGRVTKLENDGDRECPECGFDCNWSKVDLEWCDHAEEYNGPEETVYCETCGEPTEIVVTWEDSQPLAPTEPEVRPEDRPR